MLVKSYVRTYTVMYILMHTLPLSYRNATLWTPMDCAAAKGHSTLVSILLNAGADVDPTDKLKVTPLQLAAQEGHLNVVNILLENSANAGQTDQNGFNALDHAIQNGHE